MLSLFYGTDRTGVRDAANKYIAANKAPDDQVTTIEGGNFDVSHIQSALGATSLFGGEEWFLFDTPSSDAEFKEAVTSLLAELKDSPNHFVVLETSMLAPEKKKYAKHTDAISEYKAESATRFDVFAIAGALAQKDKKSLWVLLQEARVAGLRDEEIIGVLWWQLKTLRLAVVTNSAAESGVKDFPYRKAKQSLKNFKDGELEKISSDLLVLYHEGHQGLGDMDVALEKWVLGL